MSRSITAVGALVAALALKFMSRTITAVGALVAALALRRRGEQRHHERRAGRQRASGGRRDARAAGLFRRHLGDLHRDVDRAEGLS